LVNVAADEATIKADFPVEHLEMLHGVIMPVTPAAAQ
jgi:hypothetical protein